MKTHAERAALLLQAACRHPYLVLRAARQLARAQPSTVLTGDYAPLFCWLWQNAIASAARGVPAPHGEELLQRAVAEIKARFTPDGRPLQ